MIINPTRSICLNCSHIITANIIRDGDGVYLVRSCELCNENSSTLIYSDFAFYKKRYELSLSKKGFGKVGMGILEISDECDIKCSTCIANSAPGNGNVRTVQFCSDIFSLFNNSNLKPDTLVLSGGEPSIHPNVETIIQQQMKYGYSHNMMISNGIRISQDEEFVKFLSKYNNSFEVYLQFDSLSPKALQDIRGQDLSHVRKQALHNLDKYSVPTTLVSVVKSGINDQEVGETVDLAFTYKCIRGVTFQPIRTTGRHSYEVQEQHQIDSDKLVSMISEQSSTIYKSCFRPHPFNIFGITISYFHKKKSNLFGFDCGETQAPLFLHPKSSYYTDDLFRISVVEFMDIERLNSRHLAYSNIGFLYPNGTYMPLDLHYLLTSYPQLLQLNE